MAEVKGTRVLGHKVDDVAVTFTVKDVVKSESGTLLPGVLTLTFACLSPELKQQAMVHGLVQRVSDRAAMSRDGSSGKSATPEEKFEAMKVLVDHYNSGSAAWNLSGGERGPSDEVKLLATALSELYPLKGLDELTAWVRKRSKDELAALTTGEKLKPIVERLRSERAKGVDAEALLGELG